MEFAEKNGHTAWCILSVQYLNFMAGCPGIVPQKWKAIDRKCCSEVGSMRHTYAEARRDGEQAVKGG